MCQVKLGNWRRKKPRSYIDAQRLFLNWLISLEPLHYLASHIAYVFSVYCVISHLLMYSFVLKYMESKLITEEKL